MRRNCLPLLIHTEESTHNLFQMLPNFTSKYTYKGVYICYILFWANLSDIMFPISVPMVMKMNLSGQPLGCIKLQVMKVIWQRQKTCTVPDHRHGPHGHLIGQTSWQEHSCYSIRSLGRMNIKLIFKTSVTMQWISQRLMEVKRTWSNGDLTDMQQTLLSFA